MHSTTCTGSTHSHARPIRGHLGEGAGINTEPFKHQAWLADQDSTVATAVHQAWSGVRPDDLPADIDLEHFKAAVTAAASEDRVLDDWHPMHYLLQAARLRALCGDVAMQIGVELCPQTRVGCYMMNPDDLELFANVAEVALHSRSSQQDRLDYEAVFATGSANLAGAVAWLEERAEQYGYKMICMDGIEWMLRDDHQDDRTPTIARLGLPELVSEYDI